MHVCSSQPCLWMTETTIQVYTLYACNITALRLFLWSHFSQTKELVRNMVHQLRRVDEGLPCLEKSPVRYCFIMWDLSPLFIVSFVPPYGAAVQPHGGAVLILINHDRALLTWPNPFVLLFPPQSQSQKSESCLQSLWNSSLSINNHWVQCLAQTLRISVYIRYIFQQFPYVLC